METTYERLWVEGVDPKDGGWPGLRTGLVEEEDGILIERDVAVELRDGATVYVDVFRPKGVSELPVLLTMSPYGKHAPKTFDLFPGADVPAGSVSRHAVWEGPDPMWWCKQGYAVINADTRGSWGSEGDVIILAQLEAPDGYDTVEWAAQLPWCNGKVGMAGVSYLANIQWRVAAERPPSLAAINPWEGFTDAYREYLFHGGIAETKFNHFTQWSCRCSYGRVENLVELHRRHLLLDDFNASKSVRDLSVIDVPAYVVAGWGDQGLHTRGTIEGFRQISSADKWLEVHGRKKWQYYYRPESLRRQKAFFDAFLHDEPSRIAHWPGNAAGIMAAARRPQRAEELHERYGVQVAGAAAAAEPGRHAGAHREAAGHGRAAGRDRAERAGRPPDHLGGGGHRRVLHRASPARRPAGGPGDVQHPRCWWTKR